MLGIDGKRRAGIELHVGVEHLAEGRDRRALAVELADDQAHRGAVAADHRQGVAAVMEEGRRRSPRGLGQRHPGLEAAEPG